MRRSSGDSTTRSKRAATIGDLLVALMILALFMVKVAASMLVGLAVGVWIGCRWLVVGNEWGKMENDVGHAARRGTMRDYIRGRFSVRRGGWARHSCPSFEIR